MHELITVQCGERANFLGTHFWNFQQLPQAENGDLDYDVLFSEHLSPSKIRSYTPRALIFDHGRNFGSLKKYTALYHEEDFSNPSEVVQTDGEEGREHPFQNSLNASPSPDGNLLSDSNVQHWSDYNEQFYRPQSYLPVTSRSLPVVQTDYVSGCDQYSARNSSEDIMDHDLRPFLEECDLIQGINVMTSIVDSWGGFASRLLEDITNELPKTAKMIVACGKPGTRIESMSTCQSLLSMSHNVDAFVPLNSTCRGWTQSARAGAWLHLMTLPMRSRSAFLTTSDFLSFSTPGHQLLGASCGHEALGIKADFSQRQFETRLGSAYSLQTTPVHGGLKTTWTHTENPTYAASYPLETLLENVTASITDNSSATCKYLSSLENDVSSLRGHADYEERKNILDELKEMRGNYEVDEDDLMS